MDSVGSTQDVTSPIATSDALFPLLPWQGKKVTLREFEVKDITAEYISWLNDSEVVRYSNQRFFAHTHQTCQQYLDSFNRSSNRFLVIEGNVSRVMLGTLTVYWNPNHQTADIGLMVGKKDSWGSGVGFDAFNTAVEVLINSGRFRKLTAGTLIANRGMLRIMEKAGFSWEATRLDQELLDGKPIDVVHYARFRDE